MFMNGHVLNKCPFKLILKKFFKGAFTILSTHKRTATYLITSFTQLRTCRNVQSGIVCQENLVFMKSISDRGRKLYWDFVRCFRRAVKDKCKLPWKPLKVGNSGKFTCLSWTAKTSVVEAEPSVDRDHTHCTQRKATYFATTCYWNFMFLTQRYKLPRSRSHL